MPNFKRIALGITGLALIVIVVYSTLTPTDFRSLLDSECPKENCSYLVIGYEDTDRLELLTRGQDDYLRWLIHRDFFRLYDNRYIALTSKWKVSYYKTYGEDEWITLVRQPSKISIRYDNRSKNELLVTKTTPYYAYNYASGYGGDLVETFLIDPNSDFSNFPKDYSVEWLPSDKRNSYLHKLEWIVSDLEPLEDSEEGILSKDFYYFNHKVKIHWDGSLVDFATYDKQSEKLDVHFLNKTGVQRLNVTAVDPTLTRVILKFDGTNDDVYYELGEDANITVELEEYFSGNPIYATVNLTIDAPGYGADYYGNTTPYNYIWTTIAGLNEFAGGASGVNNSFTNAPENVSFTDYLELNGGDNVINATVNLTGYASGSSYPYNVKLWLNGSLLAQVAGTLKEGESSETSFNDSSSSKNRNFTTGSGSQEFFVSIPQSASVTSGYVNLTGSSVAVGYAGSVAQDHTFIESLEANGSYLLVLRNDGNGPIVYQDYWNGTYTNSLVSACTTSGLFTTPYGLADNTTHIFIGRKGSGSYSDCAYVTQTTLGGTSCGTTRELYFENGQRNNSNPVDMTGNGSRIYSIDAGSSDCYLFNYDDTFTASTVCSPIIASSKLDYNSKTNLTAQVSALDESCDSITINDDGNLLITDGYNAYEFYPNGTYTGDTFSFSAPTTDGVAFNSSSDSYFVMYYDNLYYYDTDAYPHNVTLNVGSDDDDEWTFTGNFFQTDNRTTNFSSEINDYLAICTPTNGFCDVPLRVATDSSGQVTLDGLEVNYSISFNPVTLNSTVLQSYLDNSSGWVNLTVNISSETNGSVYVNDLRLRKNGSSNITMTGEYGGNGTYVASNGGNETRVVYSEFSVASASDVIAFIPKTVNDTWVKPYGQTNSTPFWNITKTAYDKNFDVSVSLNKSLCSCITNVTISNTSDFSDGVALSTNQQTIYSDLSTNAGFWLWANLDNCSYTAFRYCNFQFNVDSCCKDCVGCW